MCDTHIHRRIMIPDMSIMSFPLMNQRDGWVTWYFMPINSISVTVRQWKDGKKADRSSSNQGLDALIHSLEYWSLGHMITSTTKGPTTLSFCGWEYSCLSVCLLDLCLKVFVFSTLIAYGVEMTRKVIRLLTWSSESKVKVKCTWSLSYNS